MSAPQVHLAKYKSRRLVDPSRMADEYVAIDEVEYSNWPVLTINSSAGDANACVTNEIKFAPTLFLASSPLMSAFYDHYRYFRCRSVEVTYTSSSAAVDYRRTQVGVYWIPDHFAYDNNRDAPISSWIDFMEKPNSHMILSKGHHGIFKLRYVPQMVYQEDIDEDENDPVQDTIHQVQGDYQSGWMPTTESNKTWELRGPLVVFRRPYSVAGGIDTPEVSYIINVRCIWEFKKAKNGN